MLEKASELDTWINPQALNWPLWHPRKPDIRRRAPKRIVGISKRPRQKLEFKAPLAAHPEKKLGGA
jgi:hypothetical protein